MFSIISTNTVFAMFRVSSEAHNGQEVRGEGVVGQNRGHQPSTFDVAYSEVTH
jgi:hypothetical protein